MTTAPSDEIEEALGRVYDPCSVAAGKPKSLIDMGLVLGWHFTEPGRLQLDLCVTFTGCTMAPHFIEGARRELLKIDGVDAVSIDVDTSFFWTPDRMSADPAPPEGATPPEPQAWRRRVSQKG
ncbi:MAG: iron-sulfur cluster assembly protein [Parvularcula sp.]|jgi:metal-sulfur cluster biosynthetic enzyme|nr:iron-sulfur cluster assembly protein [Parvularcula sp.]